MLTFIWSAEELPELTFPFSSLLLWWKSVLISPHSLGWLTHCLIRLPSKWGGLNGSTQNEKWGRRQRTFVLYSIISFNSFMFLFVKCSVYMLRCLKSSCFNRFSLYMKSGSPLLDAETFIFSLDLDLQWKLVSCAVAVLAVYLAPEGRFFFYCDATTTNSCCLLALLTVLMGS